MAAPQTNRPHILTIGEALFDQIGEGELHLGGAPLNVALHAAQLGAQSSLWSAVGQDELGERLTQALRGGGVSTRWLSEHEAYETGTVNVTVDPETSEPSYHICEGVAWDHLTWHESLGEALGELDVISYGSLCLRGAENREVIRSLWATLEARRAQGLKAPSCVFDLNLRPPFIDWELIERCFEASDALKLNLDEWTLVCERLLGEEASGGEEGERAQVSALRARYQLSWVAITRGADGLTLHHPEGVEHACGPAATGGDRVGAGDATNAALIVSLTRGLGWQRSVALAAACGAFVASQHGATPALPEALKALT